MLKDRNDSKWNRIIVLGSESNPEKVYELDRLGQLIHKFPKNPYIKSKNKFTFSKSCPNLVDSQKNDTDVTTKFINAILKYNEKDMSMVQAMITIKTQEDNHSNSNNEFDKNDVLRDPFNSPIIDDLNSSIDIFDFLSQPSYEIDSINI